MAKMSLTHASVVKASCPAPKAKVELFDTNLKNFGIEVRASGSKTFFVRYYDRHGRKRQFTIGDATLLSVADARAKAKRTLRDIELGNDPREAKAERAATPTLRTFALETYLPFAKRHKRSWPTDQQFLVHHILPQLGDKRLSELEPSDFLAIQTRLLEAGKAPATADRAIVLCRYMCNLAIRWKVPGITVNPTEHVPLLNVDNRKQRFLSAVDTQRLLASLDQPRHAKIRAIVLLLLLTGARRNEILTAQWRDVDLDRRLWHIPHTKSGEPRLIPLSAAAIDVLREQQVEAADSTYICPNPQTGQPFKHIHRAWDRVRTDADLRDVRLHDLRHSFASFLVNNGRSLYEVQRILGHTKPSMTQRYAHLDDKSLLDAADTAGAVLIQARSASSDS